MWIVIICLAYLFGISESILAYARRSKNNTVKTRRDKGSLIALYVVFSISMTAGYMLADFKTGSVSYYLTVSCGLILYLLGMIIRWTAILQLKKAFTVDVAINQQHELKTDGIYSIIRHPAYLGLWLIFIGLSVSLYSILSFIAITIPVFLVILYRIKVEEKLLTEEFGVEYQNYARNTRRLIPFIF